MSVFFAESKTFHTAIYSFVAFLTKSSLFVGPENYFKLNGYLHVVDKLLDADLEARCPCVFARVGA